MPAETLGMKVGQESLTGKAKRFLSFKVLHFRKLLFMKKESYQVARASFILCDSLLFQGCLLDLPAEELSRAESFCLLFVCLYFFFFRKGLLTSKN